MSVTELLLDVSDQDQFHSPGRSQGENDNGKDFWYLTSSIRKKLDDGAKKTKSSYSAGIYRVPDEFRKLKESAYTPRLFAIGPLHRKDPHLQTPMQQVKMCYANHLLCRLTNGMEDVLQECVAAMKESMECARKFYAEEVMVDEEMMLVDGCFILEVLYRYYLIKRKGHINGEDNGNSEGDETADPIFGDKSTRITVQHDLLLLENQIPFLVLEKLFELTVARIQANCRLTCYVSHFFRDVMSPQRKSTYNNSSKTCCSPCDCIVWIFGNKMKNSKPENEVRSGFAKRCDNYYHILHIIHDDYLPQDQTKTKEFTELMPSASQLVYAGVKFVPGTGRDLSKVKFIEPKGLFWWCRRAHFEIPSLGIYDLTESFLRNLIAFEQCCPGVSQQFTSYAYLMDMLVNSDKDVQVLEKAGVVRNYLGVSEDATHLFNELLKEAALGEFFFADPCDKAAEYSRRCWPKNMSYVRHKYFDSPWKFIAFCLAFIAFGMSIAQFVRNFLRK